MMDHVMTSVRPVTIEGLPVEWLSTRGPGRRTVLIANHSEQNWQGRIRIRATSRSYGKCVELLRDCEWPFTQDKNDYSAAVEVPAYDVGVFRWE